MDAQPDCIVSGSLATVLRLSRYAGIAPLHFEKKKTGWRITFSLGWSVYGYLLITIINLISTGTFINKVLLATKNQTTENNMVFTVKILQAILTMSTASMVVCRASRHMQFMIACLNQLQKINSELNVYRWSKSKERIKAGLFIFWVTFSVTLILAHFIHLTFDLINAEIWFNVANPLYCHNILILVMRIMQLVVIMTHVKYGFSAVNDILRRLLHALADHTTVIIGDRPFNVKNKFTRFNNYVDYLPKEMIKDGIIVSTNSCQKTVHHLSLVYTSVCDVVRDMNQSHGAIMLMFLGYILINLSYTLYKLIMNIVEGYTMQDSAKNKIEVAVQLLWCLFHTFNLVMIVEPCHLTHMEMETTRELISHLMQGTHSFYEPLAVELDLFFRQLVLNDVCYEPLKIVTMTRALVVTILGCIATNLGFLIQFGRRKAE